MTYFVPGAEEKDPKKVIYSLQQAHEKTATNTTDIATNTADIATNAADIAALTAVVATKGPGTVTSVATSGLATGGPITSTGTVTVTGAVKADQTTATSTTTAVTPAVQQNHPSAAKVCGYATYSGSTPTLQASYNVTSITDTGTGQLTVTIATDFSSANYALSVDAQNVTSNDKNTAYGSLAAGSFVCTHFTAAGTLTDPASFSFIAFGDQ